MEDNSQSQYAGSAQPYSSVVGQEEVVASSQPSQEEQRTLYITGFPFDIKQREVHNLLRFFQGFEECTFKASGVAFALFSDNLRATEALHALHGLDFDPTMRAILRVEFAKQNSKRKREYSTQEKRGEGENDMATPSRDKKRSKHTITPVVHPSLLAYSQYYSAQMAPYAAAFDPYSFPVVPPVTTPRTSRTSPNPCCTLYVSNLNLSLTEADLARILGHMEGFSRLQLLQRGDSLSAFVQFRDLSCSAAALQSLPSYPLSADGVSPIRVDYARNEMVIREDPHSAPRPPSHAQYSYAAYKP